MVSSEGSALPFLVRKGRNRTFQVKLCRVPVCKPDLGRETEGYYMTPPTGRH